MNDLGKLLVLVRGDCNCRRPGAHSAGACKRSSRTPSWRYRISRQEQHILFSVGDVDCGECGAVSGDVPDWAAGEVAISIQQSVLRGCRVREGHDFGRAEEALEIGGFSRCGGLAGRCRQPGIICCEEVRREKRTAGAEARRTSRSLAARLKSCRSRIVLFRIVPFPFCPLLSRNLSGTFSSLSASFGRG